RIPASTFERLTHGRRCGVDPVLRILQRKIRRQLLACARERLGDLSVRVLRDRDAALLSLEIDQNGPDAFGTEIQPQAEPSGHPSPSPAESTGCASRAQRFIRRRHPAGVPPGPELKSFAGLDATVGTGPPEAVVCVRATIPMFVDRPCAGGVDLR